MQKQKKSYSDPKVTVEGTLTEITQGLSTGALADAAFQVGQPVTFAS